jgi:hypothetical protein
LFLSVCTGGRGIKPQVAYSPPIDPMETSQG